jgi:hypothetical protein
MRAMEYKENPPDAGVYRIRNTATGRIVVGAAVNAAGRLNRHRFQLRGGSHPDAELQADWNELGEDAFEFEVLDHLEPRDDPDYDPTDDLALLQSMWRDRLAESGQAFYGEG